MTNTTHTVQVVVESGGHAEGLLYDLGTPENHKHYGIVDLSCDCAHDDEFWMGSFALFALAFALGLVVGVVSLIVFLHRSGTG